MNSDVKFNYYEVGDDFIIMKSYAFLRWHDWQSRNSFLKKCTAVPNKKTNFIQMQKQSQVCMKQ